MAELGDYKIQTATYNYADGMDSTACYFKDILKMLQI